MRNKMKKIYIPKKETQQINFLAKYPEFDGRGVKIAIIDGGIDVSVPGLQYTSTGSPKIVDCFDFSGNGTVDTSVVRLMDEDNILMTLSGRNLKIPQTFKNPSKKFHLGIKSLRQLCQINYKNKEYEECLNKIIFKSETLDAEDLENGEMKSKDSIDCIVWHDGDKWLSSLITYANFNDLENVTVLTNFRDSHEYCCIFDGMTACVTIGKSGNQLQIFFSANPHGTHVASIAAAHYPDDPQSSGLAPGAEIYFMEVFSGETRDNYIFDAVSVMFKCVLLGIDIINLSLDFTFTRSYFIEPLRRLGIIIIFAIGNDGPMFSSTIGEDMSEQVFFVGSMITTEIAENIFNIKSNSPPAVVQYSSKGPLSDNSRGIDFVAPGYARVQGSQWISKEPQMAHGTSIAAPNATGAIACLISALKANSIPYSPATIKLAIQNTALSINNKLATGDGIIQIDAAFEYLKKHSNPIFQNPLPRISIKSSKMNGILLIKTEKSEIKEYCINVTNFYNGSNAISWIMGLFFQSKIPWILKLFPESSPDHIKFCEAAKNNAFKVEISPKCLKSGKLYYSEIRGFHPSHPEAGSFFHLPITVIAPEIIEKNFYRTNVEIGCNQPAFLFLLPPFKARQCKFKVAFQKGKKSYFEDAIARESTKANHVNVLEFGNKNCDISLRWMGDLLEICIYKSEIVKEKSSFSFEARFG